jgi:hypothetical protein
MKIFGNFIERLLQFLFVCMYTTIAGFYFLIRAHAVECKNKQEYFMAHPLCHKSINGEPRGTAET